MKFNISSVTKPVVDLFKGGKKDKEQKKKIAYVAGGILLLLLLILLLWPKGGMAPEEFQEVRPVINAAPPQSFESASSYSGNVVLVEDGDTTNFNFVMKAVAAYENDKEINSLDMDILIESDAFDEPVKIAAEAYNVKGTIYQRFVLEEFGIDQWIKITPDTSKELLEDFGGSAPSFDVQNQLSEDTKFIQNSQVLLIDNATRHYRIVPDKKLIAEKAEAMFTVMLGLAPQIQQNFNTQDYNVFYEDAIKTLQIDFWLDEEDRVVRILSAIEMEFDPTTIVPKSPDTSDITSLSVKANLDTNVTKINALRPIVLPSEALDAKSVDELAQEAFSEFDAYDFDF